MQWFILIAYLGYLLIEDALQIHRNACKVAILRPVTNGKSTFLTSSLEEICCDGYAGPITNCTPQCLNGCPLNSYCAAPEQCECHDDYIRSINGSCVPTCKPDCPTNSFCSSPNVCNCDSGYYQIAKNCLPYCRRSCGPHGYCSRPRKCSCLEGYQLNGKWDCKPICNPPCDNSICSGPQICTCFEGFFALNSSEKCKPVCENCEYGDCLSPGLCQCWKGYSSDDIDPKCHPTMPLAKCMTNCNCWVLDSEENDTNCVPICKGDFTLIEDNCLNLSSCFCQEKDDVLICSSRQYNCHSIELPENLTSQELNNTMKREENTLGDKIIWQIICTGLLMIGFMCTIVGSFICIYCRRRRFRPAERYI